MRNAAIAIYLAVCLGTAMAADSPKASKGAKASAAPPMEQLTCRTGPNDEQVRLVVVVVKGKPMEFAYYSRFGNKVCSIHGRRGDAYTKWEDKADASHIQLLAGRADLEYKPGYAKLKFSDVTRMPYCGMYGDLNGVVEVSSSKSECVLAGVFD
jgi:hypothetical protein